MTRTFTTSLLIVILTLGSGGVAMGAEPAPTASFQKQCLGYGYKPGTDALAECVMKLDLLQRAGQGSSPQVAAPVQNQPSAPTPAPPVNKIVEPTVATKPVLAATPAPASTPTPAAAVIETTAPVQPTATAVETTAPMKQVEASPSLITVSAAALEKAKDINQKRLGQVKSIALLPIQDPFVVLSTEKTRESARLRAAGSLVLGGALGAIATSAAANSISGSSVSYEQAVASAEEELRKNKGYGAAARMALAKALAASNYEVENISQRAVATTAPFDFYRGQNAKTDAIVHLVLKRAHYWDKDDKYLRPYVEGALTLATSKYGSIFFKSEYACPIASKNASFSSEQEVIEFTMPQKRSDIISRANIGFRACIDEIVADVAATLKRPVAPPAQ
jgi:hypothetical protein